MRLTQLFVFVNGGHRALVELLQKPVILLVAQQTDLGGNQTLDILTGF